MTRRTHKKFFPWLIALAFLAVQAIAIAHELKHDLNEHNDASCVLHIHCKHTGTATNADVLPSAIYVAQIFAVLPDWTVPSSAPRLGYLSRAPPSSFLS